MSEPLLPEKQLDQAEVSPVKVSTEPAGTLVTRSYLEQSLLLGRQLSEAIDLFPKYWTDFWQAYKRPVVLLGWILAISIALKIVLAVLDAVNDIPLLAPSLELVGLGYGAWFAYRYLIAFASRQELSSQLKSLRDYLFGPA
jgi:hypothetical protein